MNNSFTKEEKISVYYLPLTITFLSLIKGVVLELGIRSSFDETKLLWLNADVLFYFICWSYFINCSNKPLSTKIATSIYFIVLLSIGVAQQIGIKPS